MKVAFPAIFLFVIAACFGNVNAQRQVFPYRTPTPTPSPTPTASPRPTPSPRPVACPKVTVQAQSAKTVRDGQPVTFGVNIAGGDPNVQPTLLWSINAGFIKEGQGTRKIEVDSTGAGSLPEREIVAQLWVGGYAPECFSQESATIKIIAPATKFGEFGELEWKDVAENLKVLANYVSQSTDNIYLIAYAGRKSERGYAMNWMRKMKEELQIDGIAPRRVIPMDGGFRDEPMFEFWIVPAGAEPPRPSPTVRRDEIVYGPTAPSRKPPG